jgi:hypothetical protein
LCCFVRRIFENFSELKKLRKLMKALRRRKSLWIQL